MSTPEIIGTLFGLLSVVLTIRASVWCWPTGLVSVAAYGVLFVDIKLYADAALQGFYVVTGVLGWWFWVRGGDQDLPISRLGARGRAATLAVTAAAIALTGYLFRSYTDAHIPYWDATASGLSVAAQLLLMRKKLENWALWVVVDVLSIGIYLYKQVYLTAGLYGLFLVLAIKGHRQWSQFYQRPSSAASATA